MVQIIPRRRSGLEDFLDSTAQSLGSAGGSYLQRLQEDKALKERGIDLSGVTNPNVRAQIVAQELQFGRNKKQAEATHGVQYNKGQRQGQVSRNEFMGGNAEEENPLYQEENVPQGRQGIRTGGRGIQGTGGNFPQETTDRQKFRRATPDEIEARGTEIAKQSTLNNRPMEKPEGIQIALDQENAKLAYNQAVGGEGLERVQAQNVYGELGANAIKTTVPGASPDLQNLFARKANDLAKTMDDETKIKSKLDTEAKNIANTMNSIENKIPRGGSLLRDVSDIFSNETRDEERDKNSIREQLKPLLEQGLYDTSRLLLANRDYDPEETEELISNLGEHTKKKLLDIPNLEIPKKPSISAHNLNPIEPIKKYNEEEEEDFTNNLGQVLQNDPKANLILLRREYQKKGYDWRIFQRGIDRLIQEGIFKIDDDQRNHYSDLSYAPEKNLRLLLKDLKLIGK